MKEQIKKITITTSARLHFNSLKMNEAGGRGCGGVGLSLKDPSLQISFSMADKVVVLGGNYFLRKEANQFAKNILEYLDISSGVNIKIINFFPNQVGLGSGTQLGLSIGRGISLLYGKKLNLCKIASITRVAGVSGIGFYSFSRAGLIIDGGYKMGEKEIKKNFGDHSPTPPPLIGRYPFPRKWKILLITPRRPLFEISEIDEKKLFLKNTPIPSAEVGVICTNVLMGLVPSLQEKDYFKFIDHLSEITTIGTKKIELELNCRSLQLINRRLSDCLAYKLVRVKNQQYKLWPNQMFLDVDKYSRDKIPFLMLSSLGHTFYSILLEDYHNIDSIMKSVKKRLPLGWDAKLTEARNTPAKISIL
jgi:beta-ribofuranosylaminobenzene 5'-phosphate synthase